MTSGSHYIHHDFGPVAGRSMNERLVGKGALDMIMLVV